MIDRTLRLIVGFVSVALALTPASIGVPLWRDTVAAAVMMTIGIGLIASAVCTWCQADNKKAPDREV